MDRQIVLASHGRLAEGLADTYKMIAGETDNDFIVFTLNYGGDTKDFAEELRKQIEDQPEREFVILCDIYGASVYSALYPLKRYANVQLFTGMNLPLLLTLCLEYRTKLTQEDITRLIDQSRQGIQTTEINEEVENEDF